MGSTDSFPPLGFQSKPVAPTGKRLAVRPQPHFEQKKFSMEGGMGRFRQSPASLTTGGSGRLHGPRKAQELPIKRFVYLREGPANSWFNFEPRPPGRLNEPGKNAGGGFRPSPRGFITRHPKGMPSITSKGEILLSGWNGGGGAGRCRRHGCFLSWILFVPALAPKTLGEIS